MKKAIIIVLTFIISLVTIMGTYKVLAKEFEKCYHCNNTGVWSCPLCGNTGTVVCDGCNGVGYCICQGEDGKGPCDNGYYTCPSCKGSGYATDEFGNSDKSMPCGYQNCNGTGKQLCWRCHGNPKIVCDRCEGKGKSECLDINCQMARQINYTCPYCKGTGYLGNGHNFPPEWNDGVHNIPVPGDYIVTNGATWEGYIYGGGSAATTEKEPEVISNDPAPVQDISHGIEPVINPEEHEKTVIDRDIEAIQTFETDNEHAKFAIEYESMGDADRSIYKSLDAARFNDIIANVNAIVSTAEVGRSTPEMDKIIDAAVVNNGYDNIEASGIIPIYFEGHEDVGFPVKVTVDIEAGLLYTSDRLYMYHLDNNGGVEFLGQASYDTYEDGSVSRITFFTHSFSSFFTAKKELIIHEEGIITPGAIDKDDKTKLDSPIPDRSDPVIDSKPNVLMPVAVISLLTIIVVSFVIYRKKHR